MCHSHLIGREWPIPRGGESSSEDSFDLPEDDVGNISKQIRKLKQIEEVCVSPRPKSGIRLRRADIPWNQAEVTAILSGIKQFGIGRWREIRDQFENVFKQNGRTSRDLCSKYWQLKRKGVCP
jgi:hypothetical protein